MSHIVQALQKLCTHRAVVPAYYHRESGQWVVAGTAKTNGGAVVIDDDGRIVQAYSSKRDALAAITKQ